MFDASIENNADKHITDLRKKRILKDKKSINA